jgi:hypothetical protein
MKRVIIESPFKGPDENVRYAVECLQDSIALGEAPFASHLLYPQALNDNSKEERLRGIVCGYQWMLVADLIAVYIDLGISSGMKAAIERAKALGKPIEYRKLHDD